jgi:hypothetical protein
VSRRTRKEIRDAKREKKLWKMFSIIVWKRKFMSAIIYFEKERERALKAERARNIIKLLMCKLSVKWGKIYENERVGWRRLMPHSLKMLIKFYLLISHFLRVRGYFGEGAGECKWLRQLVFLDDSQNSISTQFIVNSIY